jgi:hypothetical protein
MADGGSGRRRADVRGNGGVCNGGSDARAGDDVGGELDGERGDTGQMGVGTYEARHGGENPA